MRRIVVMGLMVSMGAFGLVGSATPGIAATTPADINACRAGNSWGPGPVSNSMTGATVTAVSWTSATDTLFFVNDCSFQLDLVGLNGSTEVFRYTVNSFGGSVRTAALGTTLTSIVVVKTSDALSSVTLTATPPSGGGGGGGGGGGASSSRIGSAPSPVVQEFGLPTSGTCDAAASTSLNWAGVASGGWSISWAEWMNGGQGGAVCTRTLVYDTRAAAWAVAA